MVWGAPQLAGEAAIGGGQALGGFARTQRPPPVDNIFLTLHEARSSTAANSPVCYYRFGSFVATIWAIFQALTRISRTSDEDGLSVLMPSVVKRTFGCVSLCGCASWRMDRIAGVCAQKQDGCVTASRFAADVRRFQPARWDRNPFLRAPEIVSVSQAQNRHDADGGVFEILRGRVVRRAENLPSSFTKT